MSVNLEIPSEKSLKLIAPEKNYKDAYQPMNYLKDSIIAYKQDKKLIKKTPEFAPAGQSTQLVIGASPESDWDILSLSSTLYKEQRLKRVYFSAYIPVSDDSRLPAITAPPLVRENRLYQADWLMRFYNFDASEIVSENEPNLNLNFDPKLAWALRNPGYFPINIQTADKNQLIRVPGLGTKTAYLILNARRFGKLRQEQVKKMGLAWNRAKYFLNGFLDNHLFLDWSPAKLESKLLLEINPKAQQLQLFG